MNGLPELTEAMRKMAEAYADGLALMTKTLETLPRQGPDARAVGEQWLRLARMSKDGAITAIEQGFQLWEQEVRRMLEASVSPAESAAASAPGATAPGSPPRNPLEAWADAWTRTVQELSRASAGGNWAEEARRQTAMIQQRFQEGLLAWQRLWQPPERKP
jgi:hypothetical protein